MPDYVTADSKVLFEKYELGRLLGCGAFAKVYHARNIQTGQSVAIKCITKNRIAKSGLARKNIKREISIMRRLRHPNIVRLLEVLATRTKIYFVLEFIKGGELFSRISKSGRLSEDLSRRYFQQLISAVGYCHSRGVFHRDLKPENLLLDDNGDLKVSDFGLSALPEQIRSDGLFHTLCGTPAYVAPEILSKKGYDGAKVDVWSCGVILFVLNAGYLPFNDANLMNMYRKIYRGEYRIPKWTSPGLKRLISRMLDTCPETRITVDEIVNDAWFKRGLDQKKWTAMIKFQEEEEKEEDEEEEEDRVLNAFDLISFSGVDLSGLFGAGCEHERFVSGESAEALLAKVEAVGKKEGLFVKRKGKKGQNGICLKGQNGNLVVNVRIYRFTGGFVVVEVEKGSSMAEFWKEKLRPALIGPDGDRSDRFL